MRSVLIILILLYSFSSRALERFSGFSVLSTIGDMNRVTFLSCEPKIPPHPMLPTKQFLNWSAVPPQIQSAAKAVRKFCFCEITPSNCGTFIATGQGRFITNQHVIESLGRDRIEYEKATGKKCNWYTATANGKPQKISLQVTKPGWWDHDPQGKNLDHSKDLAVLSVPELAKDPFLKIAKRPLQKNDLVYGLGYPLMGRYYNSNPSKNPNDGPSVSSGVVASLNSKNNTADFIGLNGMSGGPTLNAEGEIVGVFWGKEENKRDSGVWYKNPDGSTGLPKKMPRETSYFIPAAYLSPLIP